MNDRELSHCSGPLDVRLRVVPIVKIGDRIRADTDTLQLARKTPPRTAVSDAANASFALRVSHSIRWPPKMPLASPPFALSEPMVL